jgi:hypothetical protein
MNSDYWDKKLYGEGISSIEVACMLGDIKRLEQRVLALEAERRWIPVGERYPEENQECWVLDHKGDIFCWKHSNILTDIYMRYEYWMPAIPPEVE